MTDVSLMGRADVREMVREKYGAAALTVLNGQGAACCGGNTGGGGAGNNSCCGGDAITGGLYDAVDASAIPETAAAGLARLRQSHGAGLFSGGGNCA